MTLWMRFAPRMRRALAVALESAGTRGCEEVAIEHLAAAICQDEQSAASFIFAAAGLPRVQLLKKLEEVQPNGDSVRPIAGRLAATTLTLLSAAAVAADRWKHSHIGTEHIALALTTSDSSAGQLVRELGFNSGAAESGLRRWIAEKMPRQSVARRRPLVRRMSRWRKIVGSPVFAWKIFVQKSLAHPGFVHNPYRLYHWLRDEHPVRRDPLAPVWVISRHADVNMMLKDQRFLKDPFSVARMPMGVREQLGITTDLAPTTDVQVLSMLFLDPPQHTRVRALFSRALRRA